MNAFWNSVVRPFLVALRACAVIEIGADTGKMTKPLLEFATATNAVVDVIDPTPKFDVAEFEEQFGDAMRFHRARSHDVLEAITPADVVLIDGDHNWYTVHGELQRLESVARNAKREFPLVMLHDIEWPYGRRDLYYDPESIPEAWRQPWANGGVVWGEAVLSQTLGMNRHCAHALEEGTPRNGVLTAVEDFLTETSMQLEFQIVPGHYGLGILIPAAVLDAQPAVRAQWERLASPEFLLAHSKELYGSIMEFLYSAPAARDRS
ncbi:MAG: class I SAM-dependent methyltransferase [Solirubrobacterales bacterium]